MCVCVFVRYVYLSISCYLLCITFVAKNVWMIPFPVRESSSIELVRSKRGRPDVVSVLLADDVELASKKPRTFTTSINDLSSSSSSSSSSSLSCLLFSSSLLSSSADSRVSSTYIVPQQQQQQQQQQEKKEEPIPSLSLLASLQISPLVVPTLPSSSIQRHACRQLYFLSNEPKEPERDGKKKAATFCVRMDPKDVIIIATATCSTYATLWLAYLEKTMASCEKVEIGLIWDLQPVHLSDIVRIRLDLQRWTNRYELGVLVDTQHEHRRHPLPTASSSSSSSSSSSTVVLPSQHVTCNLQAMETYLRNSVSKNDILRVRRPLHTLTATVITFTGDRSSTALVEISRILSELILTFASPYVSVVTPTLT